MKALLLGAKKFTVIYAASFTGTALFAFVDPSPGSLSLLLLIGEISSCLAFVILCWKVIKPIKNYYTERNRREEIRDAEHRKLLEDLWDRRPEDKAPFYSALGVEQFPKGFYFTESRKP